MFVLQSEGFHEERIVSFRKINFGLSVVQNRRLEMESFRLIGNVVSEGQRTRIVEFIHF